MAAYIYLFLSLTSSGETPFSCISSLMQCDQHLFGLPHSLVSSTLAPSYLYCPCLFRGCSKYFIEIFQYMHFIAIFRAKYFTQCLTHAIFAIFDTGRSLNMHWTLSLTFSDRMSITKSKMYDDPWCSPNFTVIFS